MALRAAEVGSAAMPADDGSTRGEVAGDDDDEDDDDDDDDGSCVGNAGAAPSALVESGPLDLRP
jgi:hypothetical protein